MKKPLMFVVLTIVVIGCSLLSAQNQKPPEIQKLERYLGVWNYDGEDKTPGSGGPVTCTSTRRWITGGFFVESHRECKTPNATFHKSKFSVGIVKSDCISIGVLMAAVV